MCTTTPQRCIGCGTRWLALRKACQEDGNFSTCPALKVGQRTVQNLKQIGSTVGRRKCAECDGKGEYDGDKLRRVVSTTYGVRLGRTPGRTTSGVEIMCCAVM
jgi:hypothetical protein